MYGKRVILKCIDNKNKARYEIPNNSGICIVMLTVRLCNDHELCSVYLRLRKSEIQGFKRIFYFPIIKSGRTGLEFRRPIEEDVEVISVIRRPESHNICITELSVLIKLGERVYIKTEKKSKLCCVPYKRRSLILCSELINRYILEGKAVKNFSEFLDSNDISISSVECIATGSIHGKKMILKYINVNDKMSCKIPISDIYIFAVLLEIYTDQARTSGTIVSYLLVNKTEMQYFCNMIYYPSLSGCSLELRTNSPLSRYGKIMSVCHISSIRDQYLHELLVLKELGQATYIEMLENYKLCCIPCTKKKLILCEDMIHSYVSQQNENIIYENLKLSCERLYSSMEEHQDTVSNNSTYSVDEDSVFYPEEHIYEYINTVITHPIFCSLQKESNNCLKD